MTTLIGVMDEQDGFVHLGGDSAFTRYNTREDFGDKWIIHKGRALACAGEHVWCNICERYLGQVLGGEKAMKPDELGDFLRKYGEARGVVPQKEKHYVPDYGTDFLYFDGANLYILDTGFSWAKVEVASACGSGAAFVLAAEYALRLTGVPAVSRCQVAMEVAVKFDPNSGGKIWNHRLPIVSHPRINP